jgi:hypothetical protein
MSALVGLPWSGAGVHKPADRTALFTQRLPAHDVSGRDPGKQRSET